MIVVKSFAKGTVVLSKYDFKKVPFQISKKKVSNMLRPSKKEHVCAIEKSLCDIGSINLCCDFEEPLFSCQLIFF